MASAWASAPAVDRSAAAAVARPATGVVATLWLALGCLGLALLIEPARAWTVQQLGAVRAGTLWTVTFLILLGVTVHLLSEMPFMAGTVTVGLVLIVAAKLFTAVEGVPAAAQNEQTVRELQHAAGILADRVERKFDGAGLKQVRFVRDLGTWLLAPQRVDDNIVATREKVAASIDQLETCARRLREPPRLVGRTLVCR